MSERRRFPPVGMSGKKNCRSVVHGYFRFVVSQYMNVSLSCLLHVYPPPIFFLKPTVGIGRRRMIRKGGYSLSVGIGRRRMIRKGGYSLSVGIGWRRMIRKGGYSLSVGIGWRRIVRKEGLFSKKQARWEGMGENQSKKKKKSFFLRKDHHVQSIYGHNLD